jgi:hypothetical protein
LARAKQLDTLFEWQEVETPMPVNNSPEDSVQALVSDEVLSFADIIFPQ